MFNILQVGNTNTTGECALWRLSRAAINTLTAFNSLDESIEICQPLKSGNGASKSANSNVNPICEAHHVSADRFEAACIFWRVQEWRFFGVLFLVLKW